MKVMLSAAGSPQAVGIIRHLQTLGHYVIGHDSCLYGPGSIWANEWHQSPPATDPGYAEFIAGIPHDVYLPFLDEEIAHPFTSKLIQQRDLERFGLPVAPGALTGTVIAKPVKGRGGKGVIKINDPIVARQLRHRGDYVVQRFIDGDEYTVDVLTGLDGEFLFAVPRLRIAVSGGVSVIGQIKMDDEIIALANEVVSAFDFIGPINIQIIRERGTGKLWIIEVNPRLSGSCMFTVIAGWDILDATIKLYEGEPFVPPPKVYDIHVRRYYIEVKL